MNEELLGAVEEEGANKWVEITYMATAQKSLVPAVKRSRLPTWRVALACFISFGHWLVHSLKHLLSSKHYARCWDCCSVVKSCPTHLPSHGLYPARLLCPWDLPGKNTENELSFPPAGLLDQGLNPWFTGRLLATEPQGSPGAGEMETDNQWCWPAGLYRVQLWR